MKIVILDGYAENTGDLSWEAVEKYGDAKIYDRTSFYNEAEIQNRIGDAECVIMHKVPISRGTIEKCKNIKYIGLLGTGYDVVDLDAARERNIPVSNIPTYGTSAVGQFAIALLLEICHHIGHHNNTVHDGKWEKAPDFCYWDYPLIELAGKTAGIIGFGRIGQKTGTIAKALGMNVVANNPSQNDAGRKIAKYISRDELFAISDVIFLHCPLLPETRGIINRESISKMKDGVIIINNARGKLIVEEDLADALNSGQVAAAGLDVVSSEPIKGNNPLLSAKNCIITPHISWAPKETRARLISMAADNLAAFIAGHPVNVVNQ
jgi:glycerate dehydrogenase